MTLPFKMDYSKNEWRDLLRACLLAVLLLGGYALLLDPVVSTRVNKRRELPARMSYRPVIASQHTVSGEDSFQTLWSPVLFSLPTDVGFSSHHRVEQRSLIPPVAVSYQFSPVHRVEPQSKMPMRALWKLGLRDLLNVTDSEEAVLPVVSSVPVPQAVRPLRVEGDLSAEDFVQANLPAAVVRGRAVGPLQLELSVNAAGWVDHAFVVKSSGDEMLDQDVQRMVRQWQACDGDAGRQALVTVAIPEESVLHSQAPQGAGTP